MGLGVFLLHDSDRVCGILTVHSLDKGRTSAIVAANRDYVILLETATTLQVLMTAQKNLLIPTDWTILCALLEREVAVHYLATQGKEW